MLDLVQRKPQFTIGPFGFLPVKKWLHSADLMTVSTAEFPPVKPGKNFMTSNYVVAKLQANEILAVTDIGFLFVPDMQVRVKSSNQLFGPVAQDRTTSFYQCNACGVVEIEVISTNPEKLKSLFFRNVEWKSRNFEINGCMELKKTDKNLLLAVLFFVYCSVFWFGTLHLDLSRDMRQAFAIVNGTELPMNGQLLGGRFRLGPIWYYLLAALVWLFKGWLPIVMALAALAGTQVFFAYLLGKEMQGRQAGMVFAALVVFPSWAFYEQMFPTHVILVPALVMVAMVAAVRFAKNGKQKYLLVQGLAFSLAIHAHPTAAIAVLPLLYFNARGFFAFQCCWLAVVAALLLFLLPFSPMIAFQMQSGFAMADQVFAHALGTAETKNWSAVYLLPLRVLEGVFYVSEMLHGGRLLAGVLVLVAGVFFWVVAAARKKAFANIRKIAFDYKNTIFYAALVFLQSALLVLLSSGHAYYHTATLRLFVLAGLALVLCRVLAGIGIGKYFVAALLGATVFSNVLLLYNAARWAENGALPVNLYPLADVSAKPSLKVWLPAVAAGHVPEVQQWLCTEDFDFLHGSLASHLIYNYLIESNFGCPGKKMAVGKSPEAVQPARSFVGVPRQTGAKLKNRNFVSVGSMHVYPVLKALGPAFVSNPSVGAYPPYLNAAQHQQAARSVVQVDLQQGNVLSVTNLAHDYLQTADVLVRTKSGKTLRPLATDMQTALYQCIDCGLQKIEIIFDKNLEDRMDIVIF